MSDKKKEEKKNRIEDRDENESGENIKAREKELFEGMEFSGDDIKEMRKKAEERDSLWDKYIRSCAEFENARKRWERERQDLIKFANYSLIRELIVIVDELEQALEAIRGCGAQDEIIIGIEMTYNNLFKILKKEGLRAVDAKNKKFDPHLHEIAGQKEAPDQEEHMVLEEVQKGYLLGDKVIRTSKVILSVKKNGTDSNETESSETKSDNEN
ncbi:MAG: nucleotide exchange factor GrpE [Candidatus Omnitrophota bacterium]